MLYFHISLLAKTASDTWAGVVVLTVNRSNTGSSTTIGAAFVISRAVLITLTSQTWREGKKEALALAWLWRGTSQKEKNVFRVNSKVQLYFVKKSKLKTTWKQKVKYIKLNLPMSGTKTEYDCTITLSAINTPSVHRCVSMVIYCNKLGLLEWCLNKYPWTHIGGRAAQNCWVLVPASLKNTFFSFLFLFVCFKNMFPSLV